MIELSIVVPVYGCQESLESLYRRITDTLSDICPTWEILLVNDGSCDDAWSVIISLAEQDSRVVGLDFSRNFGQHSAINAGLDYSSGERVIVMDCDLQDRPEEIPRLLEASYQGYEVVLARRQFRKDSFIKKLMSYLFHQSMRFLTGQDYDSSVANFGCYHRKVIDAVLSMGDVSRSFPLFVRWVGFSRTYLDVEHAQREYGQSTYTFRKAMKLAVGAMMTFSNRPLRMVITFGLSMSLVAGIVAFGYLFGAVHGTFEVAGWATVVISIWLLAGIIIMIQGVIGLYVSKIFDQTKRRPLFIVREIARNIKNRSYKDK